MTPVLVERIKEVLRAQVLCSFPYIGFKRQRNPQRDTQESVRPGGVGESWALGHWGDVIHPFGLWIAPTPPDHAKKPT